jgi:hypothetical protein
MTTSILEKEYIEPDRPYSQSELQYKRDKIFKNLRLGKVLANHKNCSHFYYVKKNGRKEREIKEAKSSDVGNCSVCWKFNKTPRHLKNLARDLTDSHMKMFYESPKYMTYDDVDLETVFYRWLYEEVN